MKRKLITGALLLFLACGGSDEVEDTLRVVKVTEVSPAPITSEVYRSARLEGAEDAIIVPAVGGRISSVLVSEGDSVSVGDPLVHLVTDRQVSAGTSAAVAGINAARANADNAAQTLERMQVLYEAGAVSEYQLDGVQAASAAASAQLLAAQAQYSQAMSMAENSYVNSPFNGVVGRVWAREGNMAGGGPLLSISNASTIRASVLLPEKYLGQVQVGQPAVVELASTRQNYPGVVSAASASVDPVSGMIAVTVEFNNASGELYPGQSGRVAIGVAVSDNALSVPEIALRRSTVDSQLEYSVAVESAGTVSIVPVETGIRSGGMVEIVSGLSTGDRVLVAGQHLVAEGERVEVQE